MLRVGAMLICLASSIGLLACDGGGGPDPDVTGDGDGDGDAPGDGDGDGEPAPTAFVDVAVGYAHSCGLLDTGRTVCWGSDDHAQLQVPEGARFRALSASGDATCGIDDDGAVTCWGSLTDPPGAPDGPSLAGSFKDVAVGASHVCGIREDGTVSCNGPNYHNETAVPDGAYLWVSAGDRLTALVREDGRLLTVGDPFGPPYEFEPLPGQYFSSVSAQSGSVCGIRVNRTLACDWEASAGPTPPEGEYTQLEISMRGSQGCAVGADGAVRCFAELDDGGLLDVPTGAFAKVSVDGGHACALGKDGSVACWGDAEDPAALDVPDLAEL